MILKKEPILFHFYAANGGVGAMGMTRHEAHVLSKQMQNTIVFEDGEKRTQQSSEDWRCPTFGLEMLKSIRDSLEETIADLERESER